jgi:hypothetical protein
MKTRRLLYSSAGSLAALLVAAQPATAAIESIVGDWPASIAEGETIAFHARVTAGSGLHLAGGNGAYNFDGNYSYLSGPTSFIIPHDSTVYEPATTVLRVNDNGTFTVYLSGTEYEHNAVHQTWESGPIFASRTVMVTNVAPTIQSATLNNSSAPITVNEGQPISARMTATDPGADRIAFTINGSSAGSFSGAPGSTRTSSTQSITYTDQGSYSVAFGANDGDGGVDSTTRAVTVNNVAPTLVSMRLNSSTGLGPITVSEGATVTAEMRVTDPGADPIAFTINGNSAGTGGAIPNSTRISTTQSITYLDDGSQTVTFSADDGDGGVLTTSRMVTVRNEAPLIVSATLNGSTDSYTYINEGQSLLAHMAAIDPGADPIAFTINGNSAGSGAAVPGSTRVSNTQSINYADDGSYTVKFAADDGDGGVRDITRYVYVYNLAPVIDVLTANLSVLVGQVFSFGASAHDPGIHDILAYRWDFDGIGYYNDYFAANGSHFFATPGLYTMRLRVDDGDGGYTFGSFNVNVAAPVVGGEVPEPLSLLVWGGLIACGVVVRTGVCFLRGR